MSETAAMSHGDHDNMQEIEAIPLSELTIFPATKAQIYESRRRSYAAWGRGMTLEEYLARDAKSDEHEVSTNGRLITWILTRRDDPKGLDFLCSIETFKREGFIVDANATKGRFVVCYGLASLFTDPRYRKKGYGTHLMRMVHWVVAPPEALPPFPTDVWGEQPTREAWVGAEQIVEGHGGNGAFSTLYSDVGPEIYKACGILPGSEGWVVTDPISSGWEVDSVEVSEGADDSWEWLDLEGVCEYWKVDAELMKREMESSKTTKTICTCLPDKGVAEFQVFRRLGYLKNLSGIRHWGVRKGNVFASWTVDAKADSSYVMIITRLRANKEEFEELALVLTGFAQRHGMKELEVWGLRQELREQIGFVKTWSREDHLSSIKSYYPTELNWVYNEK